MNPQDVRLQDVDTSKGDWGIFVQSGWCGAKRWEALEKFYKRGSQEKILLRWLELFLLLSPPG
jgi:hypothetical protein